MLLCTISTLIGTTNTETTSSHIALGASLISSGSLENLTNIDVGYTAAEVLGTLKAGVRATNMEVAHNSLNVPRTGTGRNLVKPLQGDSTPKVIDRSGNDRAASGRKTRSIHKAGMVFFDRELIVDRTRNTDTSRIAKTYVKIGSKDR